MKALVVVAALTLALPAQAGTRMLGRSLDGRPITVMRVGDPAGMSVLVVGSIHGNETGGLAVARELARRSPRGIDLWIVPALNPDGVAAGRRGNARGVDLNRNFPWHWRPLGGAYESGARPLSERETRIARALVLRVRPRLTVWFHQHLNLVWAAGGNPRVERVFARVSGLPYRTRPRLPGSATAWQNATFSGTTSFVAELPAGDPGPAAVARYVRAVLAAARASR
jgi:protein MpaA